MRIYCDFDGTITKTDTTDHVLERLAGPSWLDLEDDWLSGRLTAAQCMRGQIALIEADQATLDAVLDSLEIREGFADFAAWTEKHHMPLTIISDGVDYFINRILQRHGLGHIPIFSNHLEIDAACFHLEQPLARAGCASGSGVCKCSIVAAQPTAPTTVFIGDGRSDFCVSHRADLVFARDKLATYAAERGQAFIPFNDFRDVQRALSTLLMNAAVSANG